MDTVESFARRCFDLGREVRYVAVYRSGALRLIERPGLANASAAESDRYEELIVNPTLLTLTRQRGDIDCGGLDYVIIRYGNFVQTVHPVPDGHVSVAFETDADVPPLVARARELIAAWVGGVGRVVCLALFAMLLAGSATELAAQEIARASL
jgi:hypothetical protein